LMAIVSQQPGRRGRGVELVLLLLGLAIGLYAYLQVGLATEGAPPADIVTQVGVLVVLALVTHVVLRWRAPYADPVILPVAVALNGIGLAMIHRIDIAEGSAFASRQVLWTMLGVAAAVAVVIALRDHRLLRRYTYLSMILGLVMLLLPLLPGLGRTINGARIWI